MPYEYTPPKYAQVIEELQQRIESGQYPPGSLLPSEHQLSEEFQIARPTVVRALRVLRQDGWIDTQQGRGSFVRGRPALAGLETQQTGEGALRRDESGEPGDPIEARLRVPPPRIAELLDLADDDQVLARRRVIRYDGKPSEIVTWWVAAALAEETDLADPEPLPGGVLRHLSRRTGVRVDHVVEQILARHPSGREARLLAVDKTAPMLVMYVAARDAAGEPVLVLEVVMPGDLHELEDIYQIG
ncbi:MAG: GntR family transcriptional regulator [Actinobacteria bacterium]|nr:GntR family transcriptional regulator [Actinomycetota bacterium]